VTKTELHRLIDELPDEAIGGISTLVRKVVVGEIDPDQLWFWTPEWQAKEREVDESIRRGNRGTIHLSDDEFLSSLEERSKTTAR
jgi:hypothetical protein